MSNSPCIIHLRHDQSSSDIPPSTKDGVTVFAPSWVQEGLELLVNAMKDTSFKVVDNGSNKSKVIDEFKISEKNPLSLIALQRISRNEGRNVTGVIQKGNYPNIDKKVVYSLKDLCRQTVIVGKDETTHYGGYPRNSETPTKQADPVWIVDLAGLQFQQAYNTGRLVLICEKPIEGILDHLIYEKVVGEPKMSYEKVEHVSKNDLRYVKFESKVFGNCFLDTFAYRQFVAQDVLLMGMALSESCAEIGDKVNMKFLKYGTGFFAGEFADILNWNILEGVVDGLEKLFIETKNNKVGEVIRAVELPFFAVPRPGSELDVRLKELGAKVSLEVAFSRRDCLESTMKSLGLITATTNCGDSHAAFGKICVV
jgi:hypothetical protein